MSFCEHCQGQRFDRAQVLRALRETQRKLRQSSASKAAERTLAVAIDTIRRLEIPHLEPDEDDITGESVH
ncbi:MAG TPA: hypothetical protein VM819_08340 [Vicinamibacterales bacterium]|jgi:hypothetical protein|nr:hypothetical protein [Vicinamibacterales bacterium]